MEYSSHNISEKEIKWSYWWLNNLSNFKLLGLAIAGTLIAALWLYVFYSLIMTAVDWKNELSYANIINNQPKYQLVESGVPQVLNIGQPVVLNAGQQKYDFVLPVVNENKDWMVANLKYSISYNNQSTTTIKEINILPGQRVYLTAFSVISERKPYNVNLEIIDIKWRRAVSVKTLPTDFTIETTKISLDSNNINQRAEVSITNNSLINYWEIKWLAVAYVGYQPVAIQEVTTEKVLALAKRKVYFNWNNRLPKIERLEVVPEFNVFDFSLSYKTEAETPKY